MALIIVESPTKARTFNRILKGQDFFVFATMGHIRDLPTNKISIDYDHDFKPDYAIIGKKEKVVEQIRELAKKNPEIILATPVSLRRLCPCLPTPATAFCATTSAGATGVGAGGGADWGEQPSPQAIKPIPKLLIRLLCEANIELPY